MNTCPECNRFLGSAGHREGCSKSGLSPVASDPLLDMIAGVEDGWRWDDVLRLSAMELRRAVIGGDLPRKLNVMADKIESRMSNTVISRNDTNAELTGSKQPKKGTA